MTKKELIQILDQFDDEIEIVYDDAEWGDVKDFLIYYVQPKKEVVIKGLHKYEVEPPAFLRLSWAEFGESRSNERCTKINHKN